MDLNNDGKLSKEELLYAYQNECGGTVQAELIENIMHQVDADGNGLIDYSEFLKATVDASRILSNKYLEAAFSLFDKDLSGKISQLELKETLSSVLI